MSRVTIADIEFRPAADGDDLGRVSFRVGRCLRFQRLPVRSAGGGIAIDFPPGSHDLIPGDARRQIERVVLAALATEAA